ncbi:sulfotransferase domain-containing protein [Methylomicrobium lacus]|uniref:sulfotransferase domain-containing protein n=1 Tax=Methylomicrobium lacus TaxID=136992 RepID=UPI0035A84483
MSEYTSFRNGFISEDKLPTRLEYFSKWIEYQFLEHYFAAVPQWRYFARKVSGPGTLPDFCVVGPIKGGTSDLAVNIMLHPQVMTPLAKEYDSADMDKWRILYPTEKQKHDHALNHGKAMSPFLAPYLHWMEFVYNLSKAKPEIKVVITLRNPVDRFYSQWKWEIFHSGMERARNLPFLNSFPAYVDKSLSVFPEYPMYCLPIGSITN